MDDFKTKRTLAFQTKSDIAKYVYQIKPGKSLIREYSIS